MKKLFLSLILSFNSFAIQHFTCFSEDVRSTDKVIISLEQNHLQGTLFLSSGIQDDGSHEHSAVMKLKLIQSENNINFYFAENDVAQFQIEIPILVLDKNLDDVEIKLHMKNDYAKVLQKLNCYTRIY
jgi:hypothetical protein